MAIIFATTGRTGAAGANTGNWTGVHDGAEGKNHTFGDAVDSVAIRSRRFGTNGANCNITRLFMEFDTSGISVAPGSATLNIYGNGSDTTTNPRIIVLLGEQDGSTYNGATFNDFPGNGSGWDNTTAAITPLSDVRTTAWSTSGYNTTTLNSDARDIIANEDILKIVIITYDYDYLDVDPITVSNTEDVCVGVVLNESGTSQDPYIEYEASDPRDITGPLKIQAGGKFQISAGKLSIKT